MRTTAPLKEYKRQIRQYLQTYLKAGIPLEQIDTKKVSEFLKEWLQQNLKIKRQNIEKVQNEANESKLTRPKTRRPTA